MRGRLLRSMRIALVTALALGGPAARADQGSVAAPAAPAATALRITLPEAIARSRAASARLGALASLHTAAEENLAAARANHWPIVDVSAGYQRLSSVPELTVAFPGQAPTTIFPNIQDNVHARAGLTVPLYTGGRLSAVEAAAEGESAAAAADVRAGAQDLTLETTASFWSLVTSRESARVFDDAVRAFERHLADAQAGLEVGTAARNDVLAVEVERDRAILNRLEAGNRADVANADLVRLVGASPGTVLDPVPPASMPEPSRDGLEPLVASALASRPEHAALRERATAAQDRVRADEAGYYPKAALAGGFDEARPNRRILPVTDEWDSSWDVGVNVSLDVFDFGRTRAAVSRSRAQADAAARQLEDLEARIRQEVTARVFELTSAVSAVPVADRALASATESQRVSADRFREGVAPSSELLDAEVALQRAALDRTRAVAQAHLSRASLDRAVGAAAP